MSFRVRLSAACNETVQSARQSKPLGRSTTAVGFVLPRVTHPSFSQIYSQDTVGSDLSFDQSAAALARFLRSGVCTPAWLARVNPAAAIHTGTVDIFDSLTADGPSLVDEIKDLTGTLTLQLVGPW